MKQHRVWLAVVIFVTVTYLLSGGLYYLQHALPVRKQEFNLAAFGPFVGALVVLALRRRLHLGVRWVPGFGFSAQVVRRGLFMLGVGAGVILACVQVYAWFRWPLKPVGLVRMTFFGYKPETGAVSLAIVALTILGGVLLEEIGWRALLEPTVRQRCSVPVTALVVGLMWGTWQWPWLSYALRRWGQRPRVSEVGLYLIAYFVSVVAISLIMVVVHNRMKKGQWIAAVAFRWPFVLGTFLLFDEERGRWQPMATLAMSCSVAAAVAFYYYWRTLNKTPRAKQPPKIASGKPGLSQHS